MTTRPHRSLPAWEDQAQLLTDLALTDLRADDDVRPTLSAFRGPDPLFLATLRPFDRGGHQAPIIEVGALAMSLGADRVMLSLAGRAWSMADPIPPVVDGVGDLRQRIVVLHEADATGSEPVTASTLIPIEDGHGTVSLGTPLPRSDGVGWVPAALLTLVQVPPEVVDPIELGLQVVRCERLGHQLAWSPTVVPLVRECAQLVMGDSEGATAPAATPGW